MLDFFLTYVFPYNGIVAGLLVSGNLRKHLYDKSVFGMFRDRFLAVASMATVTGQGRILVSSEIILK